jgi:hypothetical protein
MKLADKNCICDNCLNIDCKAKRIIMDLQSAIAHAGHSDVRVTFETIECLKPERKYKEKDKIEYPEKNENT